MTVCLTVIQLLKSNKSKMSAATQHNYHVIRGKTLEHFNEAYRIMRDEGWLTIAPSVVNWMHLPSVTVLLTTIEGDDIGTQTINH